MEFSIVNVVLTADTGCPINLGNLGKRDGFVFTPKKYPCVYFKDQYMQGKASIFRSGKIILVGAKSVMKGKKEIGHLIKTIQNLGYLQNNEVEIRVQNIVATFDVGCNLNLETISMSSENAVYEPEQFPGLILRLDDSQITVLVFGSGKIVLPGLKSEALIPKVIKFVRKFLLSFCE